MNRMLISEASTLVSFIFDLDFVIGAVLSKRYTNPSVELISVFGRLWLRSKKQSVGSKITFSNGFLVILTTIKGHLVHKSKFANLTPQTSFSFFLGWTRKEIQ